MFARVALLVILACLVIPGPSLAGHQIDGTVGYGKLFLVPQNPDIEARELNLLSASVGWTAPLSEKNNLYLGWGLEEQAMTEIMCGYGRNEGNWEFHLSVYAANWTPPEAGNYMNLTSDYHGQLLPVDSTVQVELILSLAEDVEDLTSFSFDLIIEVEG